MRIWETPQESVNIYIFHDGETKVWMVSMHVVSMHLLTPPPASTLPTPLLMESLHTWLPMG